MNPTSRGHASGRGLTALSGEPRRRSAPADRRNHIAMPPSRRQPALTVTLLVAMTAAPMITCGVSALAPLLRSELNLSRTELGSFAIVLYTATAVLSVPLGRFVDKTPYRAGLVLNYVLAATALVTMAVARSYPGLLIAAGIGGMALALSNPVTNYMVGALSDPARRGIILATKHTGVQLGQMLTALLYPAAAAVLTWRAGFGLGALLVVIALSITLLWLLPRIERTAKVGAGSEGTPLLHVPSARPRQVLTVYVIYAVLSGLIFQAIAFGLPLFAHESLHLSVGASAMTVAVLGATGFASRLGWGRLTDRSRHTRWMLVSVSALTVAAILLLLAASAHQVAWALWAGAAIYGASGAAVTVILTSAVLRGYPLASTGLVTGVVSLGTFVGFAVGPTLFGLITDFAGYPTAWTALAATAGVAALIPLTLRSNASRPRHVPNPP